METICLNCNQPTKIKSTGRANKYCSTKCKDQYKHKTKYKPVEEHKKFLTKCAGCGVTFEAKNSRAKFCTRKCQRKINAPRYSHFCVLVLYSF